MKTRKNTFILFLVGQLSLVEYSIAESKPASAPLICTKSYTAASGFKLIECKFRNIPILNQEHFKIPDRYNNSRINKFNSCGATATAALYSVIDKNREYYQPSENSFLDQTSKNNLYQKKTEGLIKYTRTILDPIYEKMIPELYLKIKTDLKYGATPWNIQQNAFNPSNFKKPIRSFYHFLTPEIQNDVVEKYHQDVTNKNALMNLLVGFYKPTCKKILETKVCTFVVPDSLHYEALIGVSGDAFGDSNKVFSGHRMILSDGYYNETRTYLETFNHGCQKYSYYDVLDGFNFWKMKATYRRVKVCNLDYVLPFMASKSQRFTSDDDGETWTFVHGKVGIMDQ